MVATRRSGHRQEPAEEAPAELKPQAKRPRTAKKACDHASGDAGAHPANAPPPPAAPEAAAAAAGPGEAALDEHQDHVVEVQQQQPTDMANSAQTSGSDDDDDEGDGEDVFQGSRLMASLARSLGEALAATAGQQHADTHAGVDPDEDRRRRARTASSTSALEVCWQPEAKAPQQRKPSRAVHQAGVTAVKEAGLAKQLLAPPRLPPQDKAADRKAPATAGKKWYDLPATQVTDDVKQELRLLRLRSAYDPKRFYKNLDSTKFPKFFQVGTVVDNPQDYYTGRLTARERGETLTQELLNDQDITWARKKRYNRLMDEATKYQRVKKRKTDLPRNKKKPAKPKH